MSGYDVVLTFYNDYYFINRCIQNINSQTLLPNNLIFVDDGNRDKNLKKKIRNLLNKKIKLIFISNSINIKVERSLLKAFKYIKSKYFYLQGADDIHYKKFAFKNIEVLEKNPHVVFTFSNLVINNAINKNKYLIRLSFLKEKYYTSEEMGKIFQKNQFKIYQNTVMFRSNFFIKNHIFSPKFRRSDYLNSSYFCFLKGCYFINSYLSEFTYRKKQYGSRILKDDILIDELNILKKYKINFYKFFIKNNMHYDLSIFSILKMLRNNHYNGINFRWLLRSIKFRIWKMIRFMVSTKILQILFIFFRKI